MVLFFLLPALLEAAEGGIWWRLLAWFMLVLTLSTGVSVLLSRQLFRPLTSLTHQINLLRQRLEQSQSQTGLGVRVPDNAPPEIEALGNSFNALLNQVNLEQHRRRSFTAMLMHDMKTPLIAANNLLTIIKDNQQMSAQERSILLGQMIVENSTLLDLVQKNVEAHRFEREDIPLHKKEENLKIIVQRVFARVRSLADEKGVVLEVKGNASAEVDARELERALYNLVANGVRYAKHAIKIEVYPNLLRLSDDGPGLPAPLEQLAQPFNSQPIHIAGKTYTAGTSGLGLFIAKRIFEMHGGRLITESSTRRGTVFLAYLSGN